jgi:hypothetical protein
MPVESAEHADVMRWPGAGRLQTALRLSSAWLATRAGASGISMALRTTPGPGLRTPWAAVQGAQRRRAFQEPMTSALRGTGHVSTLYDLTTKESTVGVFGHPFPAHVAEH